MRKLIAYGPSVIVLAAAAIVLAAGPATVYRLTHAQTAARVLQAARGLDHNNVLAQINQAYRDIAAFVEPSVVHISAQRTREEGPQGQPLAPPQSPLSTGSGWIYDDHGHVVTNYHVIQGARRIDVQLYNGETRSAHVIGFDPTTDIAVLKIPPQRLFPALRRAADDPLGGPVRQGDIVFAFGSPFDFRFSMSQGVVSGQGRSVGVIRDHLGRRTGYENFIQVDAAINPGNSGGPLTDYRGHVIGMNTAIATGNRRGNWGAEESYFAGVGLAIPIEMIEPVVEQLITTGVVEKGFLGVHIVERSHTIAQMLVQADFRGSGLYVATVEPGLIAGADLLPGDVIVRANDEEVRRIEDVLASRRPGGGAATAADVHDAVVDLAVWRFSPQLGIGGRGLVQSVQVPVSALRAMTGLTLLELHERVGRLLDVQGFIGGGVPVGRVEQGGPAATAGILRGDVITHINDRPVASIDQVRSTVSSMLPEDRGGGPARLRIWRFGAPAPGAGSPGPENRAAVMTIDVPLARLDPLRIAGPVVERLGILRMATLTPRLAEDIGTTWQPGVLVQALEPGSVAADVLRPNSIVLRVGDQAVSTVDELVAELERANLFGGVRIAVVNPDGNHVAAVLRLR
jgi:serine protease Do